MHACACDVRGGEPEAEGLSDGSGGAELIIKSIGFCAAGPASVAVTP